MVSGRRRGMCEMWSHPPRTDIAKCYLCAELITNVLTYSIISFFASANEVVLPCISLSVCFYVKTTDQTRDVSMDSEELVKFCKFLASGSGLKV